MVTHRVQTTLQQDGKLLLDDLLFHAGEVVEIVIVAMPKHAQHDDRYPLRDTPIRYDLPFEPVTSDD